VSGGGCAPLPRCPAGGRCAPLPPLRPSAAAPRRRPAAGCRPLGRPARMQAGRGERAGLWRWGGSGCGLGVRIRLRHPPPARPARRRSPACVCGAAAASRQEKRTALHEAARYGHAPCVDSLLKAGADASLKDEVSDGAEGRGGRREGVGARGQGGGCGGRGPVHRRRAASLRRPAPGLLPPGRPPPPPPPPPSPSQDGDTALDDAKRRGHTEVVTRHTEVVTLLENAAIAAQVGRAAPHAAPSYTPCARPLCLSAVPSDRYPHRAPSLPAAQPYFYYRRFIIYAMPYTFGGPAMADMCMHMHMCMHIIRKCGMCMCMCMYVHMYMCICIYVSVVITAPAYMQVRRNLVLDPTGTVSPALSQASRSRRHSSRIMRRRRGRRRRRRRRRRPHQRRRQQRRSGCCSRWRRCRSTRSHSAQRRRRPSPTATPRALPVSLTW